MSIIQTSWHNFPAYVLESEALRLVIAPDLGAKIVSLYDKIHKREWLVPPMRPVRQTAYGDDFVSQDMCGWDEMMPTIVACEYEGKPLPDHGEVWSIPWKMESADGVLSFSVDGIALPYRFTRTAAMITPEMLELRYCLLNTGKQAFPYLWAAHPQFAADEHTRLLLPPEVTRVVNVIENDPLLGRTGAEYPWPEAVSVTGTTLRLDRFLPAASRSCRKVYVPPGQPIAWAALADEKLGCQLRLDWSVSAAPYLGLWFDGGQYNSTPVIALEPASGYYDSLERAVGSQRISILEPGKATFWTLRVGMGTLDVPPF